MLGAIVFDEMQSVNQFINQSVKQFISLSKTKEKNMEREKKR